MNICVRGKIKYNQGKWMVDLPLMNCQVEEEKLLQCLKRIELQLKSDLQNEKVNFMFRVGDNGYIDVITHRSPEIIQFLDFLS